MARTVRTALAPLPPVIWPLETAALVPRRPGDRVKTNRRDAEKLARLYRAGGNHHGRMPDLGNLPLYLVATRASFIDEEGTAPIGQALDQARNGFRVILDRQHIRRPCRLRRQYRGRDLLLMDVEPNHRARLVHEPAPPYVDRSTLGGQPTSNYAGCRLVHAI